jgi:hypothetical protein
MGILRFAQQIPHNEQRGFSNSPSLSFPGRIIATFNNRNKLCR